MSLAGPAFYDDDAVFATYLAARRRAGNPNDTLEKPLIDALAGEVAGKRVLDLGCGDAAYGREVLARGAREYVGVEGSRNMVAALQKVNANVTYIEVPGGSHSDVVVPNLPRAFEFMSTHRKRITPTVRQ